MYLIRTTPQISGGRWKCFNPTLHTWQLGQLAVCRRPDNVTAGNSRCWRGSTFNLMYETYRISSKDRNTFGYRLPVTTYPFCWFMATFRFTNTILDCISHFTNNFHHGRRLSGKGLIKILESALKLRASLVFSTVFKHSPNHLTESQFLHKLFFIIDRPVFVLPTSSTTKLLKLHWKHSMVSRYTLTCNITQFSSRYLKTKSRHFQRDFRDSLHSTQSMWNATNFTFQKIHIKPIFTSMTSRSMLPFIMA